MSIEVRPATSFDDVCTMVGPKRPDANVCWCLSYRLSSKENRELTGKARGAKVKRLLKKGPLGVLAYEADEVVGWAAEKVDLTMAYVGTRQLFEKAGFEKAADTTSTLGGFPRVLMRLVLP